jgi:hypothetical protein
MEFTIDLSGTLSLCILGILYSLCEAEECGASLLAISSAIIGERSNLPFYLANRFYGETSVYRII